MMRQIVFKVHGTTTKIGARSTAWDFVGKKRD